MNWIANLRLLAFVAAVLCAALSVWRREVLFAFPAVVLLAAFVALVRYHNALGRARRRCDELYSVNDEALKRLARDWDALPLRHSPSVEPDHPYAADLDIFGRGSLFHLLDTTATRMGEETLSAWLGEAAPPDTVRERQGAVAELAWLVDLRDELAVLGRLMGDPKPDPAPLLAWAEGGPWLLPRRKLLWVARGGVVLLWTLAVAQLTGLIPYRLWVLAALFNLAISLTAGRRVHDILSRTFYQEEAFRGYADLLRLLSEASFTSPALRRLQAGLAVDGTPANAHMRRLHWLASLVIPASAVLYVPVQALTLWDFHVLTALERWQSTAGPRARGWLAALGEAEALSALATLAHDNPDWAFPDIDPAAPSMQARGLGHPLLPGNNRVVNDVEVGPPSAFLLVTGSNMSGKSTLLRSIGTNIVLTGAGGPVCASALQLPPVELWTSMRIDDSLQRGVSYFMAELQRLKKVVDAARQCQTAGERRFFYLLDEILQGTNTVERQIAARRIIGRLVSQDAIGAVSTHDLTLAGAGEIADAARPVHFTETIRAGEDGPVMTFDYKLRPGIATSTNALRLLEIVGLELDDEPSS